MALLLGNSGAPRWYDCDLDRFERYLDLLEESGATGAEIVLHDGDADEFTSRVHVVRNDWNRVVGGYLDRGLYLTVHGPLTPEFSPMRWRDEPTETMRNYQPVLQQVAEIAEAQGGSTLVLHAVADANEDQRSNEAATAQFLDTISDVLTQWSSKVTVAVELRAYRLSRPTAAATSRESVVRIIQQTEHSAVGICWDVAHDLESRIALNEPWEDPDDEFLERVRHVHLHDLGPDEEPHYPPLVGRVPIESALGRLSRVPAIMEVRWRMAERMGDPWDVLRQSYERVIPRSRS